jgi:hypothetical protein
MKKLFFSLATCFILASAFGQPAERREKVVLDGHVLTMIITEAGDTLLIANLDEMSVSSPRAFASDADKLLYDRYRRYAVKVYPYAVEAIKVFREVEYYTQDMKKRERKKRLKVLQADLESKFEEPLRKLTKTQGYILMKMIERELDTPIYSLIKNLRGGFTATYWSTMGWFYGHHIKEGYTEGEDRILDIVLRDFDISYSVPPGSRLESYDKYFNPKKKVKDDGSEEDED